MKKLFVSLAIVLAVGCVAKNPPQEHATRYVSHYMESHDANLVVQRADSVKNMLPMFESVYRTGQEDRRTKLPMVNAQARALELKKELTTHFRKGAKGDYSNHKGQTIELQLSDREINGLAEQMAQSYLDGYNGK